jgi:CubicO group peptidase (beta-lactamase class C family)
MSQSFIPMELTMPYILAILLSLFALSGCNNNESNTPSPLPKLQIQQQTLKNHPTLAGKWTGKWSGQLPSAVVVEEITGGAANIVYSWGSNPSLNIKEGYQRLKAQLTEGKQLEWKMGGGHYQFTQEKQQLEGQVYFPRSGETYYISMKKQAITPDDYAKAEQITAISSPKALNDGWPIAAIEDTPLAPHTMLSLLQDLAQAEYPNIHSLVVAYDGKLVVEQYMSGADVRAAETVGVIEHSPTTLHDMRSVSKSVTALVLGTVLDLKEDNILNRPMSELLDIENDSLFTLEQALTMTSGIQWNEMDVSYADENNDELQLSIAVDPVNYVFGKPQQEAPGSKWYYNGGMTQLLAQLAMKKSGEPLTELVQKNVFEPLQIESFEWLGPEQRVDNMPNAASGLRLTTRDLTKIGQLILNNGQWHGKQVVNKRWVDKMTTRHVEHTGDWSRDGIWGYGYQWWIGQFDNPVEFDVIAAVGWGGQRLYVVPEYSLVVAITAWHYDQSTFYGDEILGRIVEAAVTK